MPMTADQAEALCDALAAEGIHRNLLCVGIGPDGEVDETQPRDEHEWSVFLSDGEKGEECRPTIERVLREQGMTDPRLRRNRIEASDTMEIDAHGPDGLFEDDQGSWWPSDEYQLVAGRAVKRTAECGE